MTTGEFTEHLRQS